ncbi:jerky-like protein [Trichonephila clavipes]|nr:jerky-like protein [Trichonephila clavipes]
MNTFSNSLNRKQVLRRLLLAENNEESVAAFSEKLTCYMLAEAWDSLERQSLKNAWNKLWPDLEGEKDFKTVTTGRRLPTLSDRSQDFKNAMKM